MGYHTLKCAKIRLRPHETSKIFPGVIPQTPAKQGGIKDGMKEREGGRNGNRMERRERRGRSGEWAREEEGKEGEGKGGRGRDGKRGKGRGEKGYVQF